MAVLPTRDELFQRARDAALAVPNTRVSAREFDRAGSDANLLAAAMSLVGEEVVNRMARALAGVFEDTATGNALDRVIFDRKGLVRKPSAPAVGTVQLTRATTAGGAGTIDGGVPGSSPSPTRIRTNQGITYILTQPAVFGAADLGPIQVTVQAELSGLDSEVDANQSWSFVDSPFDPTITIANAEATAGASNEESDEAFRDRAKQFFPTIRRGTLGAIEFGLQSTPGVESVSVREVLQSSGLPACVVQAFILDALGRSNDTLAARGQTNLIEFRAAGIPVQIISGSIQNVPIRFGNLDFDTSIVVDTTQAFEDARTAIVVALNNQTPGQTLLRSTILAAARTVPGVLVEDTDLEEPIGSLIPATNDVTFRTRRELITTTGSL